MSHDPLQDLRAGLVRAARRRHRPWWRRRPALLGFLVVLLAAAPATAAISTLWRPDVPPLPPARTTVATRVSASAPRCVQNPGLRAGHGTTDLVPPKDMTDAFAVLRRPQTAADRAGGRYARVMIAGKLASAAVRTVGPDANGDPKFLVPSLIDVPARPRTEHCPARPAVRTWMLSVAGRSGGGTSPYRDFIARGTFGTSGPSDRESVVSGIVPDGVASVTVTYGSADPRTFPTHDNAFTYEVGLAAEQFPSSVVWNDADGRPIKRVH
ncbi:hypothetical protein AB0L40_04015 [Patulibacter sp. NPDC049589]|uniref:hypothetical protein n=1 Tax=Patulibacter sp. NPDC049589 TaxID=3154731 RepID=UPI0034491008